MTLLLALGLGCALLISGILVPFIIRVAKRLDAIAQPGGRHIHAEATPRLGGLAIAAGVFVAVLVVLLLAPAPVLALPATPLLTALVGGSLAMVVLGAVDDVRGLRARHKLLFQIAVACAAYACGLRVAGLYVPGIGNVALGALALPVTVLWIVGVINALNLIDGLDGLAGGVVFLAALTNLVVALISGHTLVGVLMAATMGATLAFLAYNFNPARVFMGDSGSYFLGFLLAAASTLGPSQKTSTAISLLVPFIALGLPIFDTIFAIIRRFARRMPLCSADRGHLHHRLLDLGLTPRRAVLMLYAVSVAFTGCAILIAIGRERTVGFALFVVSAVVVAVVRLVILPARRRHAACLERRPGKVHRGPDLARPE